MSGYDFSDHRFVNARKVYSCGLCGAAIAVGTRHEYWAGVCEGVFQYGRRHLECSSIYTRCLIENGAFYDDDLPQGIHALLYEMGSQALIDEFNAFAQGMGAILVVVSEDASR